MTLFSTFEPMGTPHLSLFVHHNPSLPYEIICGPRLEAGQRLSSWRNCDRAIREWYLGAGQKLSFDHLLFSEGDVLWNARVADVIDLVDFGGCGFQYFGKTPFDYPEDTKHLPAPIQPFAAQVKPLAVMVISRPVLHKIMTDPLSEEAFSRDIFCEVRMASLAQYFGAKLSHLVGLRKLFFWPQPREKCVLHPVKVANVFKTT